MNAVDGVADILPGGDDDGEGQQDHGGDAPETHNSQVSVVQGPPKYTSSKVYLFLEISWCINSVD